MNSLNTFLIRVSSFVRKEIAEILRQPRLVATLILGPFLILFIFGIGYNNSLRTMRTIMVVPDDSKIRDEITEIAGRLTGAVDLIDIVSTQEEAEKRLDAGEADLILMTPADPFGDIETGQHAEMDIIHHEIDPLEELYVNTLERAYVEEVNKLITIRAIDKAKEESAQVQTRIGVARTDAAGLVQDLEAGDSAASLDDIIALAQDFQEINLAISSSLAAFEGVQSMAADDQGKTPFDSLTNAEKVLLELQEFDPEQEDFGLAITQATTLENELAVMDEFFGKFVEVDSRVLARPFAGKTVQFNSVTFGPIDFYVPGVISLLLQHIAITLAALSIVREKVGGSIELFRAAPISSFETLLGKSISFMLMGGILAAVLTLLVILGLRVPMLGTWFAYSAVILALLYTSLGLGFAISTISQTDSQAVQYSMIVLLASIFFSGFFIALHRLITGVHIVSWMIPATYGTALLQDVMLRGLPPDLTLLLGLILFGVLLYTFAWWRLRRLMARE